MCKTVTRIIFIFYSISTTFARTWFVYFSNLRFLFNNSFLNCSRRIFKKFQMIIWVLDILDDTGWFERMRVKRAQTKHTLVIPEFHLAKVCRSYKHVTSLWVLDDIDIFGLSLAESMRGEPVANNVPLFFLAGRVKVGSVYRHTLCMNGFLFLGPSKVEITHFVCLRLDWGSHCSIKKDSFPLVTNDHHLVAMRVHSPAWVHLHHGQVLVDNHAIADVDRVNVSTFL